MAAALHDYDLRPPSRGRPVTRFDSYLDTSGFNNTREIIAPSRNRSSTPSAAVRRAMQVLDETKRQQSLIKNDRWSRSVEFDRLINEPIRKHRSPSPIRSRSTSPMRNYSPPLWAPSRLMELERDNFHEALDDSEARREILLRKLADAQKTMEIQNDRLRDGEMDVSECRATIRLLQQVQKELEVKTQFLQKERESFLAKSKQLAEERETQKRKIDEVTHECSRLRCQLDLLLADKQQHHVTLQHMHKSIKDLKEEIKNKNERHASTSSELEASKERLKVAKQRSELLEKEKNHAFSEFEKTRKKQQALVNRNTELGQRIGRSEADLQELSERYDKTNYELGHNREELAMCRDKIKKLNRDLMELRRSHAELQADRERALKYNDELEKTLQSMKEINKELKQAKVTCEDDLTELHGDLARTRLELTRVSEENLSNKTQLNESRKSCKKLTQEVLQLRPQVEDLMGKVQEWEGAHRIDVQKMALLEAQKSQLTCEKEDALTRLSTLKESYDELKTHHEREVKKLSKETRELRQEKERITSQHRDSQAQYARIRDEMEANNEHTQTQLDHWRQACSKLTSLVEEKDEDLRECATQRREAEENCALAEAQNRTLEIQFDEAQASQEELSKLRMEQKRLSQECAENQQLISVLEMQRDILAKSPSKSSSGDTSSKVQIVKLEEELKLLHAKLIQTEAEKRGLEQNISVSAHPGENSVEVKRLKGMNQILAEEVAKMKQEMETLQVLLEEKSRANDRDVRELTREKQQLDLRMASMVDELNALRSSQMRKSNETNSEVNGLKAELEWLKQDLDEKKQELIVMKGEAMILENAKYRADDRVTILETSLEDARSEKRRSIPQSAEKKIEKASSDIRIKDAKLEAAEAENAVLRLQTQELENAKSSQNTLIEALRKQLEKNAGSSGDSDSSGNPQHHVTKEIKSLKKELQKALEEMSAKDKQLTELKKKFVESQRKEQRLRQERDELQGKAIIMESLNDSSHDLLKELEEVRKEKSGLETQLNNFLTSKTSQTPPTSLSLVDDLDRELEKQYRTVCKRNKWLESRIASLQREIELLRDQNSLALEQRTTTEREAARLREELKNLQITSKGSRRQNEAEQIHLQHSNAEKMQKILDLERDLSEKKQLIRAMTKEIENVQKKSEKGKISAFMKKLRRSSDSGRDSQRLFDSNGEGDNTVPVFPGFDSSPSTFDHGYSTMSMTQPMQRRAQSLSPKPKSASFGGFPGSSHSLSRSPKSPNISQIPLSPTLTYVTATDPETEEYAPSTGDRTPQRSTGGKQLKTRVSFEESSGAENTGDSPSSKQGSQSYTSSSPKHDSARGDDGAFFADDYIDEDSRPPILKSPKERLSQAPSPESHEPFPEELGGLPSPTSSPSLPSPTAGRNRSLPVYVVAASDESEESLSEYGSDEVEEIGRNQSHYPPPLRVMHSDPQLVPSSSLKVSPGNSPPPRPQSQPTFKDAALPIITSHTKKKRSSLV